MNIFILNENPIQAAHDMCNRHVVKMIVESAQILSTAFRLKMEKRFGLSHKDKRFYPRLYKSTHSRHPAVKWVGESKHNTAWLWHHTLALVSEYNKRYNKFHKTQEVISEIELIRWMMWSDYGSWELHTPFVQCMPEQYRCDSAVEAYRNYYINDKARFAQWAPRATAPAWWPFPDRPEQEEVHET